MDIRTHKCIKIDTKDSHGIGNGFLVPVYNKHDGFIPDGEEPQQVYLTVVAPGKIKGPHLHYIRTGRFVCIRGNIRIVVKVNNTYETFYSGEAHSYQLIEVPRGVPAALQNLGGEEAYVLNLPTPAWTPEMNDEHTANFDDFDFNS